jgi:hypothetical protein
VTTTRRSLYNIWCRDRHGIKSLVERKKAAVVGNEPDGSGGNADRTGRLSATAENNSSRHSNPASPVRQRPTRRIRKHKSVGGDKIDTAVVSESSIAFSTSEWKNAFSRTDQKMKPGWPDIFANKLESSGFNCTLRFKTPYFKKGKRKKNCRFFCCYATCTTSICARKFQIILKKVPCNSTAMLFLVRAIGEENHNADIETAARQLRGEERFLVGLYF